MASVRSKADCDLSVSVLNGRIVAPDELVEIDDETFQSVTWPDSTWQVVDVPEDPRTAEQLRDELRRRGLPTSGRKPELAKRLAEAPPEQPVTAPAPVTKPETDGE